MTSRVELATHHPRHQAGISRQYLVGPDHGETVAEHQHDPGVDSGQLAWQYDMLGDFNLPSAVPAVVPVDPKQIQRMSLVATHAVESAPYFSRDRVRIGKLRKGRKQNVGLPKPLDRTLVAVAVNNGLQEPVSGGIDRKNHGLRLSPAHQSHQPSINQARTAVGTAPTVVNNYIFLAPDGIKIYSLLCHGSR